MLNWFKPRCPVDTAAKDWVEFRLDWLSGQFGRDVFTKRPIIEPTPEFFPDPVVKTQKSVRNLLDQVCQYMDVDPHRVSLEMFTNPNKLWLVNDQGKYLPTGAAGLYQSVSGHAKIQIETSELGDLVGLVGTMAHELSHLRLMGENRVRGSEFDNELLTDLTAVFFGFGIFMGNSPRNWDSQYDLWPGTELKRPEYMTLPMFAYSIAHAAWFRNERKPEWYSHLSSDMKPCFKQAIGYLTNTQDSSFTPDHAG